MIAQKKQKLVIVGNGMVGYKLCEKLAARKAGEKYDISVIAEERIPAYDRVRLSEYFSGVTVKELTLAPLEWYDIQEMDLYLNQKAEFLDVDKKTLKTTKGHVLDFDKLVLATGSYPFVPPVEGLDRPGVFVYRTIEDLDNIRYYADSTKRAAVIGGGLLGLEAAKALVDLKVETHIIEHASRLMPRQIDAQGSVCLEEKIKDLGVQIHFNRQIKGFEGSPDVQKISFEDATSLDVDMVVISAGIRPRDELARQHDIAVGPRGGIIINAHLQTSCTDIYAIGECALFNETIYGLVAPGYQMADVLAAGLMGENKVFEGADMSTKLKLLGVDVASIGNPFMEGAHIRPLVMQDDTRGIYMKLLIDTEQKKLCGAILVGDNSAYTQLLHLYQSGQSVSDNPASLVVKMRSDSQDNGAGSLPPEAHVCSCENITKAVIEEAVKGGADTVSAIKSCTKAGTGCGGCLPLITDILNTELKKQGRTVKTNLCGCFNHSRVELAEIIRSQKIRSYWQILGQYGKGKGCEICKPAVASILASYHNEHVMNHQNIQDTNDTFLANIQKNGSYSVVPRVPGGEITPDQLIAIGEAAREFQLYTKITGGQRIDLFGATLEQLPEIWKKLRSAGLESGHAYAKALRTVKSCVGSTWCRFGVQDSVGLAIRIENRYKGLRAPHKIKSAVSGCSRECAEAQSKDFGVIATEKGYNLYICGNGGMKPQHARLFVEDLDEKTLIRYVDRFLMYYIRTADKLTRTATWLNTFEGGIERLKDILIHDALGICTELEQEMQHQVTSYVCEWSAVLDDPQKMKRFRPFLNTDEPDETIEFISERGQKRPLVKESRDMAGV